MMTDIEKLLLQSDKAELLEWLQSNLPDTEKCFIAIAKKDGNGLVMSHSQFGNRYQFELVGFVEWIGRYVEALGGFGGDDDDDEDGESE